MNTTDVAAALHTISQGFRDLAVAIEQPPFRGAAEPERAATEGPSSVGQPARSDTDEWLPPLVDEPHDPVDEAPRAVKPVAVPSQAEGSLAVCPKHRVPYTQGTYGPYCKERTDDPAWGKEKGDVLWCKITPKNVDVWLRQHSGVPA